MEMKPSKLYRSGLVLAELALVVTQFWGWGLKAVEAEGEADPGNPTIYLPVVMVNFYTKPPLPAPVIPSGFPTNSWIGEIKPATYPSRLDGSTQSAYLYTPGFTSSPVPLLVGLHTWSRDYRDFIGGQQATPIFNAPYAQWAKVNGWVFISPNFEGSNDPGSPNTTGSDKAVQDVVDAVYYARSRKDANIDPHRIYLIGQSGGGHMALLMAGRHPEIWAGVSAWASISDLAEWRDEVYPINSKFSYDIERACGDVVAHTINVEDCLRRSAINYLTSSQAFNNQFMNLDINAGINDGHNGKPVPIRQSFRLFNQIAYPQDLISPTDIDEMTNNATIPPTLSAQGPWPDQPYDQAMMQGGTTVENRKILYRKISGNARITIFTGDHEIIYWAGLSWLAQQWRPD